jgi:hypothetical protein
VVIPYSNEQDPIVSTAVLKDSIMAQEMDMPLPFHVSDKHEHELKQLKTALICLSVDEQASMSV